MLQRRDQRNRTTNSLFDSFAHDDRSLFDDCEFFGSSLLQRESFDPFGGMMNALSNWEGYSSSSYSSYSYSSSGPGRQPVVIQKSITERRNGQDMTERYETYSNTAEGVEKATVGRRIGDRARIIEKSRKTASGEENTLDTLHNLDENTAADFDREWQSRAGSMGRLSYDRRDADVPIRHTTRLLEQPAAQQSKPKHKDKKTTNLRYGKH